MAVEDFLHQMPEFDVVLAVCLGDFGQAVLSEDQLEVGRELIAFVKSTEASIAKL